MKKMKLFTGILIIVLTLTMSSYLVSASTYNTGHPDLELLLEEVTPEPVEPGQDVTVKIRIINEGGDAAEDVSVKLNTEEAFYLKTTSDDPKKTKNLCVGCSMDNTYYLSVDSDAKSGMHPLTFRISTSDINITPKETVDIKVVGKPDILLETKGMDKNVTSGDIFDIKFNVKNIGTGVARDVKIIPDSDKIFMPGSNVHLIDELGPEKNKEFTSEFIIKESLIPDTYSFPISMKYTDEEGNSYTKSSNIGINVLDKAEIGIQSIKTNPTTPTLSDEIQLEGILENTGKGEANKVKIELVYGNKEYKSFIGQLEADDDSPFFFNVKPEHAGTNTAKLKISYHDDFGSHEIETTLENEVQKPKNNVLIILVILGVVGIIIGYFFYRKKAKK